MPEVYKETATYQKLVRQQRNIFVAGVYSTSRYA